MRRTSHVGADRWRRGARRGPRGANFVARRVNRTLCSRPEQFLHGAADDGIPQLPVDLIANGRARLVSAEWWSSLARRTEMGGAAPRLRPPIDYVGAVGRVLEVAFANGCRLHGVRRASPTE